MLGDIHKYPVVIKETNLDVFGHMNNATYLVLFEDARWDLIRRNGYGVPKVQETGLGPVILKMSVEYLKEIHLRDEIVIETSMLKYEKKVGTMRQRMMRKEEVCCTAEFIIGLFDLNSRKLVSPTPEWIRAVGL